MAFTVALSLLLGKLCLLTLLYRVFGHIDRVRHQIYWTGVLCFPLLASCAISPVLASPPLGKPWGTENPHNKEGSIVTVAIGATNIVVDLLIVYMPLPSIASLNLSRKRKVGVLAIFLTGSMYVNHVTGQRELLTMLQSNRCRRCGHVLSGSAIKASRPPPRRDGCRLVQVRTIDVLLYHHFDPQ
jgi:hypothetical protein